MSDQPSLHQKLITSLVHDPRQAVSLAQAQMDAITPVYQQLREVVREGAAGPRFLEGARMAVSAMEAYMQALRTVAQQPDVRILTESYAFVIQAQQNLKEAHDQAVYTLPLPPLPIPQNLVDLQGLVVGWMEGLVGREDVESACDSLISIYDNAYTQLANADAIASRWEPEQVEELGNVMRTLETGYLGGIEALGSLKVLRRAEDVRTVWPQLLESFTILQGAHKAVEELEDRMGPIEFLEDFRFRVW